jgi:fermentation-respiration switch protein FrsA (DUF1100 family)
MGKFKRSMVVFLKIAFVIYILLGLYMFIRQRTLLYFPPRIEADVTKSGLNGAREITVTTEDGLGLRGWYAPSPENKPVIVFFHGNASNIGTVTGRMRPYNRAGYGLLLAEYRGYARNPGRPTEQGLYADGRAFLAALSGELGIPPSNTVIYGQSLGSGVATKMAAELAEAGTPARALVLESPYTSVPAAGQRRYPIYPVRLMMWDRFDSLSRIGSIGTPLFLIHGEADHTVPVDLGHDLFDAAAEPKTAVFVPGAGHNDLYGHGAGPFILSFLDQLPDS